MDDGLTPERVEQAMARPGVGDELHALGVRDVSGFNPAGASEFLWPEANEERIRQVVDEALVDFETDREPPAADELDAAPIEPDLSGRPMPALSVAMGIKLYSEGATQYRVRTDTKLSPRQAKRVWTWVKSGAVWWEKVEKRGKVEQHARAAKGFRLVSTGEGDSAKLQLVRV
jgi:hypothetical protein